MRSIARPDETVRTTWTILTVAGKSWPVAMRKPWLLGTAATGIRRSCTEQWVRPGISLRLTTSVEEDAMTKIIPTDKARQGHWGRHLLLILLTALVLVVIVWGLVEIYGRMIEPDQPTTSAMSDVVVPLRDFGSPMRG